MSDNTFTNRINVTRAAKQENGNVRLLWTFCGGLHFPKDGGKPFTIVQRSTKNGKTFKQVRATLVIAPDDKKSEKGYPVSPIYYDGANKTFAEILSANGVELFNGRLYVPVTMDRNTMGLYQLMGDPTLDFKANILCSGELSIYQGKDGKKYSAIGNVSIFARDHVFDDKVERANANCQLDDGGNGGGNGGENSGEQSASAPSYGYNQSSNTSGFVEINDDDGELPF